MYIKMKYRFEKKKKLVISSLKETEIALII